MAYDFPQNPGTGDEYQGYVWDSVAWNIKPADAVTPPTGDFVLKAGDTMTGDLLMNAPARVVQRGNPPATTGMVTLSGGAVGRTGMVEFLNDTQIRLARLGWGTPTNIEFKFEGGCKGLSMLDGGLNFGSASVTDPVDLSRHVALYGSVFGFSVTSGTINYVVPAANRHCFRVGTGESMVIANSVVTINGDVQINEVNPYLTFAKPDGGWNYLGGIRFNTGTLNRWNIEFENGDENFLISRVPNSGSPIGVMRMYRNTGVTDFESTPTVAGVQLARKPDVDALNSRIDQLEADITELRGRLTGRRP